MRRAERFTRSEVHDRYETAGTIGASCRPQDRKRAEPGYVYHRWSCLWMDTGDDTCGAFIIARNSRGPDWYFVQLLKGPTPL